MRKPEHLREVLRRVVPHVRDHPESLALFVDQGRVAARAGATLSFEYLYTVNLVVQDYAGDLNAVTVPLLAWIAQHQPELLERSDSEPFTFESEVLDAELLDLSIKIALTERVAVTAREGGGYEVRALDEPTLTDAFAGVCDATLLQLWFGSELAAPPTP